MTMRLIRLRDHPCNCCGGGGRRISGALERLGLYRCKHGIVAVPWEYDADGDVLAIEGHFETETAARAALAAIEPGHSSENVGPS
jgi:hypothetical protein